MTKSKSNSRRRTYQLIAILLIVAAAIPIGASVGADAQTNENIRESDYDFNHTLLFLGFDANYLGTPDTVNVTLSNQSVSETYTIERQDRIGTSTAVGQYHYVESDIDNPTVESVERLNPSVTEVVTRATDPTIRSIGTPETSELRVTVSTSEPIDWESQRIWFYGQSGYSASNNPNIGTLDVVEKSSTEIVIVANSTYPGHPGWESIDGPVHMTIHPEDKSNIKYPITDISANSGPLIPPPSSQGNGQILIIIILIVAAYLYAK